MRKHRGNSRKKTKKQPVKKLARRKKPSGIEGFFLAVVEAASAGLNLYKKSKPIIQKLKPIKKKGNKNGNNSGKKINRV